MNIGLATLSQQQRDILISVLMHNVNYETRMILMLEYPAIYSQLTGVFTKVTTENYTATYPNAGYQANNFTLKPREVTQ